MSELKVFELKVGKNLETDSPLVVGVDDKWNSRVMSGEKVYLKSEADKVIADLKADYKEACDRLQTANLIKDEQLAATSHQKYKRCLNKAEWCEERCARYDVLQERTGFSWRREIDFYFRWSQRWLELADQFSDKEA
jgi:hypothetical protein